MSVKPRGNAFRRIARHGLLVATLALLPALATADQTATTVRLRIVVMRHGVRSPTSAPDDLAVYANRPWHAWPVEPGMLTEHGTAGITALGQRYAQLLANDGLLARGCHALEPLVVIADSTPRNHASGAALLRGLAPDCHANYLALSPDQPNHLFHYSGTKDAKKPAPAAPDAANWPPAALAELQRVLLGCDGDACLAQAHSDGRTLLLATTPQDDDARTKAMKSAGSLSENLMLEYAEGVPAAQVAWGQGDAATIGRLITLHDLEFAVSNKRMPAAAHVASNLMAHVLATWQQAAGVTPLATPLADAKTKVVFLIGHDTNLANLAGVIDADWHDPRQPDDYPPGGALLFDLLEDHGHYLVRISSLMPTLDALRNDDFSNPDALVRHVLPLPACHGATVCPLETISPWLDARLDHASIENALPALTRWPADTSH